MGWGGGLPFNFEDIIRSFQELSNDNYINSFQTDVTRAKLFQVEEGSTQPKYKHYCIIHVYYCHDHLGFVFIYTGTTAAQSITNVKDWINQITAHALGTSHVLYQHSGKRGPNPLLLERLDHNQVRRLTLYYTAIVVYPISHI